MGVGAFFYLQYIDDPSIAVASGVDDLPLTPSLIQSIAREDWVEPDLTIGVGRIVDYIPSNLPLRLCSETLRVAMESAAVRGDALDWLPAPVRDGAGTAIKYDALRVAPTLDILDRGRSIMVGEHVVKAVIDPILATDRAIVMFPGDITRLLVTDRVRQAILDAGCTGVSFAEASSARRN